MATSIADRHPSDPLRTVDNVRPQMAKVGLHRTSESDAVGSSDADGIGVIAQQTVVKHYGTVKAASISLRCDPSQMMRDLAAGKLGVLDRDPDARAVVVEALNAAHGRLHDPKAQARLMVKAMRQQLDALEQYLDHVA